MYHPLLLISSVGGGVSILRCLGEINYKFNSDISNMVCLADIMVCLHLCVYAHMNMQSLEFVVLLMKFTI